MYKINQKVSLKLYKNYLVSLCKKLKKIGININTIPVLDVLRRNTNKIIGNRSFSADARIVKKFGEETIKICHSNNIISVMKHMPGHGCSSIDSHMSMPKVNLSEKSLNQKIFTHLSYLRKLAMTAHILYSKIDPKMFQLFQKR